jgi:hypothetical protein
MAWINSFLTSVRKLPTLIFPYRSTERKPSTRNSTNLLAYYKCMLCVIHLLFTFFDILSNSFYKGTMNSMNFIFSQIQFFFFQIFG